MRKILLAVGFVCSIVSFSTHAQSQGCSYMGGYPWKTGGCLVADDLNAAIAGRNPLLNTEQAPNKWVNYFKNGEAVTTQPKFSDLAGTLPPDSIPPASALSPGGVFAYTSPASEFFYSLDGTGRFASRQASFMDIAGVAAPTQIPFPSTTGIGGVKSYTAPAGQYLTGISTNGTVTSTIPSGGVIQTNEFLKATVGSSGLRVLRAGFTTPGDGGMTYYDWSASNCSTADNGAQVQPTGVTGCWIADFSTGLSVLQFGAILDTSSDSTTAIRAADVAAARLNLTVHFPNGNYAVSSCINQTAPKWQGENRDYTRIWTASATDCVVNIVTASTEMHDLSFASSVTRTGGAYLPVSKGGNKLVRVTLYDAYDGISANTGTASLYLDDVTTFHTINDSIVVLDCLNCQANHVNLIGDNSAPTASSTGLHIFNAGDFTCHNCSILLHQYGIRINPASSQVAVSFKMIGGFVDNNLKEGLRIDPSGGGIVARSNWTGVWFASSPNNNITIVPAASAFVDGLTFADCESYLAPAASGLAITGPAKNISWIGGKIAQNAIGVYLLNASNITIADAIIGATSDMTANTSAGMSIGGTSSNIDVHDVQQLPSNGGSKINYGATGGNNRIHDNPGYNPIGVALVTVTASPFTYTAGPYNETIYGYGGAVTNVTQGGQIIATPAAASWSSNLGPNEAIIVTYTGAPTMRRFQH